MDQTAIRRRSSNPGRRLLLKTVQNIDGLLETNRVSHPISATPIILNQLKK